MPEQIGVHDAANVADLSAMVAEARRLVSLFGEAEDDTSAPTTDDIEPNPNLIGLDDAVYRQIRSALKSGKRHLLFYGPPGTGKTELARYIAESVSSNESFTMLTGSADWSSQDLIGGYQPIGDGKVAFIPGVLLKHFDEPLVIDELNRCDIDKVLGPMFSVLSNASTTLPYRVEVEKVDSDQYEILGELRPNTPAHVFSPHPNWRIIATINTLDKASLYQMSYALSRRFAWIFVEAPSDLDGFIRDFLTVQGVAAVPPDGGFVLKRIWESVGNRRPMGPAPVIDVIKHCQAEITGFDFAASPPDAAAVTAYLDAFRVHIMPMLDGLLKSDLQAIAAEVTAALGVPAEDGRAKALARHIEALGL